ncbi:MAG: hypothetical protein M1831_000867 [Alyxoria varia]|nr:MAG: hypothetical protein M1831_000867 [Alyxoria varia]
MYFSTRKRIPIRVLVLIQLTLISSVAFAIPTPADNEPSQNASSRTDHPQEEKRQGWTDQPDGRGTLDILWSCLVTLFLCSWSVQCSNVPGPEESTFQVLVRKTGLAALCILGPEAPMLNAAAQYKSAQRSVDLFRASGFRDWTVMRGFYADMGGIIFQPCDWKSFPVNAEQLHYLVLKGYVEYPHLSEDSIRDKNKVDGVLRAITVLQSLWFSFNVCIRAAQSLPISTLELTTSAFIVCTAATSFCWRHKPADVRSSDVVHSDVGIAEILLAAGDIAREPYSRTPLDFVDRTEWHWSQFWSSGMNLLRKLGMNYVQEARPIQRIENTTWRKMSLSEALPFYLIGGGYLAIFVAGWNYSFPTKTERTLWRIASLTAVCTTVACTASVEFLFDFYPKLRRYFAHKPTQSDGEDHTTTEKVTTNTYDYHHQVSPYPQSPKLAGRPTRSQSHEQGALRGFLARTARGIRNNTVSKDPYMTLPLKAIIPLYIIFGAYSLARVYIWVSDFVELRSLPARAYKTVDWWGMLPHA